MRRSNQRGSNLAIVLIAGAALSFLILLFANTLSTHSKHMVHYNGMSSATAIADSAFHESLGKLTLNPIAYLDPSFSDPVDVEDGQYEVRVERRDFDDVANGYFMVVSATQTLKGHSYETEIYAYVEISNVGDYFAAVREDLNISNNADVSQGKIYGKRLYFDIDGNPATKTRVKKAEYVYSTDPETPWTSGTKDEVEISEPSSNEPVQLPYPLLFPQLLESDLEYYQTKAYVDFDDLSSGHHKCLFSGEIFPPGYCGSMDPSDGYGNHTTVSKDHVYYCTGTISLQGNVHGQVLFVAEQNIDITGNLTVDDLTTTSDNNGYLLPGEGTATACKSSSTAHQAILMTRGSVFIDTGTIVNQYGPWPPGSPVTITIQAMVLSPNGTIGPRSGAINPTISSNLKLDFTGSLILASSPDFATLFQAPTNPRTYDYMTTLGTHPPPDLPYLTDVHHAFEK